MRAAVFRSPGEPLRVEQLADPTPGAREVVIRVGRCGICATDLHLTEAENPAADPPHPILRAMKQRFGPGSVLGHEYAGEVVAVGDRGATPEDRRSHHGDAVCGLWNLCRLSRGAAHVVHPAAIDAGRVRRVHPGRRAIRDSPACVALVGRWGARRTARRRAPRRGCRDAPAGRARAGARGGTHGTRDRLLGASARRRRDRRQCPQRASCRDGRNHGRDGVRGARRRSSCARCSCARWGPGRGIRVCRRSRTARARHGMRRAEGCA